MARQPLLLSALLLLCGGSAFAQGNRKDTKVVLYKDRIAAQWDTVDCVKNVLKLNPLLFLRGEAPLYYERALSPRISAELAVGVTFRNYIGGDLAGDDADDFSAGTHIITKPSYHLGFRYYLTYDLEPQGMYLQGGFAYVDHSKDISVRDSTGAFTDVSLRDQRLYNDVRLYLGYQRLSGTSNWLIDFYGGIGLRNRSLKKVDEHFDLTEKTWSYSTEEKHDNVPAFFLGIKIGYGF
ncbi:MAG: hypothetical protein JST38_18820 [Bacteroidetes bacterium]|nr:hypothetical protein [Bacteroidota bacterium]MBS1942923.1 hypothetical protein [Bacteroidota bacterium]